MRGCTVTPKNCVWNSALGVWVWSMAWVNQPSELFKRIRKTRPLLGSHSNAGAPSSYRLPLGWRKGPLPLMGSGSFHHPQHEAWQLECQLDFASPSPRCWVPLQSAQTVYKLTQQPSMNTNHGNKNRQDQGFAGLYVSILKQQLLPWKLIWRQTYFRLKQCTDF